MRAAIFRIDEVLFVFVVIGLRRWICQYFRFPVCPPKFGLVSSVELVCYCVYRIL